MPWRNVVVFRNMTVSDVKECLDYQEIKDLFWIDLFCRRKNLIVDLMDIMIRVHGHVWNDIGLIYPAVGLQLRLDNNIFNLCILYYYFMNYSVCLWILLSSQISCMLFRIGPNHYNIAKSVCFIFGGFYAIAFSANLNTNTFVFDFYMSGGHNIYAVSVIDCCIIHNINLNQP